MQDGNYQDALRFYDEIKTMQALYNQAQVKFMLKIFWQAFYLFYCIFLKQNGKPHSDWWLQQNTDIQPSETKEFCIESEFCVKLEFAWQNNTSNENFLLFDYYLI